MLQIERERERERKRERGGFSLPSIMSYRILFIHVYSIFMR